MSIFYDFPNLSPEQRATNKTIATIENSARHQALIDAERRAFGEAEKKNAELEAEAEKHRLARESELRVEEKARREQAAANFEQNSREQFFAGNPHASESDYLSVKGELKKQAMLANVDSADKSERFLRESGNYSPM
jgi:polyribonucleotide nucleotidyltransferase